MNVISFSLYGNNPKYVEGMKRNLELAEKFYPGWKVTVRSEAPQGVPPMMARLLVADLPDVDRFIVRDADSRLSQREADCVQAWIESDTLAHYIVDHRNQRVPSGGLSGFQWRRANAPQMEWLIKVFLATYKGDTDNQGTTDEDFYKAVLWPMFAHSYLLHDVLQRKEFNGQPFPTPRTEWPRFCGEIWEIDENSNEYPHPVDYESTPKDGDGD